MEQLGVLPLGDKTLVMNRHSGKWAYINTRHVATLGSLEQMAPTEQIPRTPVERALRMELADAGLYDGPYHPSGGLTTLILKLTKVCNYRCVYCYDMEPDDRLVHLQESTAKRAIMEAVELVEHTLVIIFHGGEPTLFFDLIKDLVLYAEQAGRLFGKKVKFITQTNLSRLTTEVVSFSAEHPMSWGISLDGPPNLNDRLRVLPNGDGTYQYFSRAMAEFPEFVRSCGVLSTITSHNEDHLLEIARYFRDLGIPSWGWSLFQAIGKAREHNGQLAISYPRLVKSWDLLFRAVEEGEFDGFAINPVLHYLANFVNGPTLNNMCMRKECGAGRDLVSVSADGTVEACDCIDRKGPMGGIGLVRIETNDSLRRSRESDRATMIRTRNVEVGECGRCIWLAVCGGTCLAYAPTLHSKSEGQCMVSMNAFTRIAESIASSGDLRRYWDSVQGGRPH